jgi:phosphoenolpyruvate-protein kinase (PTS system EI component)
MSALQASPFVPGIATGVLRRHGRPAPTDILLLPYAALERLDAHPAALILIGGAPLAHPMIRLYGFGIPTVVVSAAQAAQLQEGRTLRVDGYSGRISAPAESGESPSPEIVTPSSGQPVHTADGVPIELRASVADRQGVANAVANGASAIGMVRSEFLVPEDGSAPDEIFYTATLQQLCQQAGTLPVTVRTLDLAPDKHPDWLGEIPAMRGPLGLRGARLYDEEAVRPVFQAELRALAKLANECGLRLLLPYMTRPEEYPPLREAIRRTFDAPLPLGVMIETPAAALALPEWLRLVDFVVIGCNDLMQCLFAADRDIPQVAGLLDPYSPVLYRFLSLMAESVRAELHRVQLGGLLPQVPGVLPLLVGLGYRNFSAEPLLTPCLATLVTRCDTVAASTLAERACAAGSAAEVRELLGLPGRFLWGGAMH